MTGAVEQAARTATSNSEVAASMSRTRVSFVAVGDNVPNDVLAAYADEQAGSVGDGDYDYRPLFAHIKEYTSEADLSYINQEVHIGGEDIGPRGWPSFNTTDSMADAVVDTGFDFVASASNHSYDWGLYGAVEHSREVWNAQPVAFTGTATSWEEANEIPVVERNGIKFALLDYTYGVGGFERNELPEYAVNYIDEDRIREDVPQAKALADVVLVAMHWGTENQIEPDDDELYYAQLLADLDVDVILGSHPHVTQPMTWLTGESGHRTLVCYSLGNFIIQHAAPTPNNDLEGMLSCDFVRHDAEGEDGTIEIENIEWIPLVYHGVEGEYAVWALKDYPAEMAKRNPAYEGIDDPIAWMREESDRIVNMYGDDFAIDA
ncbi:MAG: CapA family protein [Eggerthellaceae bacterium]|nr:CapA family protein [Eggerthellaceae bacterium]